MKSPNVWYFLAGLAIGSGLGILGAKMPPSDGITHSPKTWLDSLDRADGQGSDRENTAEFNYAQCYLKDSPQSQTPLFSIGSQLVILEDLPLVEQSRILRISEEMWIRQNQILDDIALRMSLSDTPTPKNGTIPEIVELAKTDVAVDPKEVEAFYKTNKAGFPKNADFKTLSPTILSHLKAQKVDLWVQQKRVELGQKGLVHKSANIACPPRVSINLDSFMALDGGKDATIDTFLLTDPFCLSCRTLWPQVETIRSQSKRRLRLRPVPLISRDTGEVGEILAKAQYCAQKDGPDRLEKWLDVAHRAPFELRTSASEVRKWVTSQGAAEAQLVATDLSACLDSEEAKRFVEAAKTVAKSLIIEQAPAAYANGRRIVTKDKSGDEIRSVLDKLSKEASL